MRAVIKARPLCMEDTDNMERYKQEFIEFMVESNVLKFGDFTLKRGSLCDRDPA